MREIDKLATEALLQIQSLYAIEREADEMGATVEQRGELRRTKAYPLLVIFEKWLYDNYTTHLPSDHNLDRYDFSHFNGISKPEMKQLRELVWMDNCYNLVLMGPPGVGKTYLAAGLVHDAAKMGYKSYFKTMEEILEILKLKDISGKSLNAYKRLLKADLIAIDDIMLFPMKKSDAVSFFNLINALHGMCSIIITTNKSPKEWAETLDDEVVATALLDRLLFKCEVVKLEGNSYRMDNRKTIFNKPTPNGDA